MPERSCEVLLLSEKVKVHLIRKKKSYGKVAKIGSQNKSSNPKTVKKGKRLQASFALAPLTAKVNGHSPFRGLS